MKSFAAPAFTRTERKPANRPDVSFSTARNSGTGYLESQKNSIKKQIRDIKIKEILCQLMKNIFGDNSDPDLIKAVGKRDNQAFERLINRYKKPLYNFVYRYLQDHSAAEEVVQEVFLRIYQAAPKYKAVNNVKASTWIFKIA
ncbi:MAG: RNA polymerase sigma factor, partial [Candidatus Contubernalis sp.]|nr:RNA polymerase sigma factor [Candidatus Contubernalis sp.]